MFRLDSHNLPVADWFSGVARADQICTQCGGTGVAEE